ncbi:MAG: FAD:protein FMN transferase [Solirubrobacterales bacterium]|nr:FAD:protein FMN transferase [Solirubrobacterales bacterium]
MSSQPSDLIRLDAFGTVAVVTATDPARLDVAAGAVSGVVDEFDRACSRFRPDSELSMVNASAGLAVRVGPLLVEAVSAALRAARLTAGDVDPTVGEALIALGYDRDFDELSVVSGEPSFVLDGPGRPGRPLAAVSGWRTVQVDREAGTIRVAPGVSLDLGATAKALAADHAAAAAHEAADCGVLVSLGGDLAISGPAPDEGWRVRVTDDHRAGVSAPGQWISLRVGGLATSSVAVRRWQTDAGVAHHLIDPATGGSVDSAWRTVSVCAASCLDANIASTAAIVRGSRARAWLSELRLPSRLVAVDGTVCHVAGWPSAGDELPVGSAVGVEEGRN